MHCESCRWGEKGAESLFEDVMTKNFPNLKKKTDTQIHETEGIPIRINPKRPILKHFIIKLPEKQSL